jgi:hypothetical protein
VTYSVQSDRMLAPQSVTDSTGTVKWTANYNAYGDTSSLIGSGVTLRGLRIANVSGLYKRFLRLLRQNVHCFEKVFDDVHREL